MILTVSSKSHLTLVSIDVERLFTNVLLDITIGIIMSKKIENSNPKSILKELLYLCTK